MKGATSEIASAISNIVQLWREYLSTGDKRRMQKCIRIGDEIIDLILSLEVRDKKLNKLINKRQKYNN